MSNKLRAGEFKMKADKEDPVWSDRKRLTIFALPISFTIYTLTPSRIAIQKGAAQYQRRGNHAFPGT